MAVNFDSDIFYNDEHLGVNIKNEIKRCFVEDDDLFSADDFKNKVLDKMVNGSLSHPAKIYMKREITGNLFNL